MKRLTVFLFLLFIALTEQTISQTKKWHDKIKAKIIELPAGDYSDEDWNKASSRFAEHSCGENDVMIISDTIGSAIYQEWSDYTGTCQLHKEYGAIVAGKYKTITKKVYDDIVKVKKDRYIIERNYPVPTSRKEIKEKTDNYGWWTGSTASFPGGVKIKFNESEICKCGHHVKVTTTEACCPYH